MSDIEDMISPQHTKFLKELIKYEYKSEKGFTQKFNELRKSLKTCPSKPTLRKIYNDLVTSGEIDRNPSFLKYSLKRKIRSQSGVSVITIMTSPKPSFTDEDGKLIIDDFSCGNSCAYCPNEPEITLNLKIKEISSNGLKLKVTTNDNIKVIRVLTYIIVNGINYDVKQCSQFKTDNFIIHLNEKIENIKMGDDIIGYKEGQPRSYINTEPAVGRANRKKFDPILQIYDRSDALISCGHEVDKIEILILGGTWDHYRYGYQREFIRDTYYGINTLNHRGVPKATLEEEIEINQTSKKRLIGLTIETRPDCINLKQIKRLREFNVTRVQIGVQHIDDNILLEIQRGCFTKDTIKANHLWKQNGGKIDWHLMPGLPGSSLEIDINMFKEIFGVISLNQISKNHYKYVLKRPELQTDQLKIYPCSITDWTLIKEWYDNGTYKPYIENEEELIKVIIFVKENVFPWIRINRIIRDIPTINIIGGSKNPNLHQQINDTNKIESQDIRSREVKGNVEGVENAELFIREYNSVKARELFISFESPDQKIIYGFLRLRFNDNNNDLIYDSIKNCAFVRELHVYGDIVKHDSTSKRVQHQGFGKRLLKKAEDLSIENGYYKVAIISGVGVREYYKNRGYTLEDNYMIKTLNIDSILSPFHYFTILSIIFTLILSIIYDIYN